METGDTVHFEMKGAARSPRLSQGNLRLPGRRKVLRDPVCVEVMRNEEVEVERGPVVQVQTERDATREIGIVVEERAQRAGGTALLGADRQGPAHAGRPPPVAGTVVTPVTSAQ